MSEGAGSLASEVLGKRAFDGDTDIISRTAQSVEEFDVVVVTGPRRKAPCVGSVGVREHICAADNGVDGLGFPLHVERVSEVAYANATDFACERRSFGHCVDEVAFAAM